ncbi:hypothetical protein SCLCIDRAFT_11188 [Scleroderma citrinum Foug A]|uniref:Uncharacterized protein n=1 Tax=Scleroderma citrinum Foug A TaxID=1036808 RepID=A0A0C2ZQG8_9AGAM|nr:hypothetical protein SCLCIDRAFT_11188 [Scleroderma citrinum Foug A]
MKYAHLTILSTIRRGASERDMETVLPGVTNATDHAPSQITLGDTLIVDAKNLKGIRYRPETASLGRVWAGKGRKSGPSGSDLQRMDVLISIVLVLLQTRWYTLRAESRDSDPAWQVKVTAMVEAQEVKSVKVEICVGIARNATRAQSTRSSPDYTMNSKKRNMEPLFAKNYSQDFIGMSPNLVSINDDMLKGPEVSYTPPPPFSTGIRLRSILITLVAAGT